MFLVFFSRGWLLSLAVIFAFLLVLGNFAQAEPVSLSLTLSMVKENIHFIPTMGDVYRSPVFVHLTCAEVLNASSRFQIPCRTDNYYILVYRNNDPVGFVYDKPFWITETTMLTAVLLYRDSFSEKGEKGSREYLSQVIERGVYTIIRENTSHLSSPIVYPTEGAYLGPLRVFVRTFFQDDRIRVYYSLKNGIRRPLRFPYIIVIGCEPIREDSMCSENLTVWQENTITGEIVSTSHQQYFLYPAISPSIVYREQNRDLAEAQWNRLEPNTTVSTVLALRCIDPLNRSLPLTVESWNYQDNEFAAVNRAAEDEILLSLAGRYRLNCEYHSQVDDGSVTQHSTSQLVTLESRQIFPLQRVLAPLCESTALRVPMRLMVAVPKEADLEAHVVGGVESNDPVEILQPNSAGTLKNAIIVFTPASKSENVHFRIRLVPRHDEDAIDLLYPTPYSECRINFVSPGSTSTSLALSRISCEANDPNEKYIRAQDNKALSLSCLTRVKTAVGWCVGLNNTDLVQVASSGPEGYVGVSLLGLPDKDDDKAGSIMKQYTESVAACVEEGLLEYGIRSSLVEDPIVALGWRVSYGTNVASPSMTIMAGTPVILEVVGNHVELGSYYLVEAAGNCDHVGILPVNSGEKMAREGHLLTFVPPLPGKYILCARFNIQQEGTTKTYEVRSFSHHPLVVTVASLPTLSSTSDNMSRRAPCGGSVKNDEPAREALKFSLQPNGDGPHHTIMWYGLNAEEWKQQEIQTPIQIPSFNSSYPLSIVSAIVKSSPTTSATCIYYPASLPETNEEHKYTYHFYKVHRSKSLAMVGSSGSSDDIVLISVKGEFKPHDMAELKVFAAGNAIGSASIGKSPLFRTVLTPAATSKTVTRSINHFSSYGLPVEGMPISDESFSFTQDLPMRVVLLINGNEIEVEPSVEGIALSDLALRMEPDESCSSGFGYQGDCVCFGDVNRTAYLCDSDSSSSSSSSTSSTPAPSTSSTEGPNETKDVFAARIFSLVLYFILLISITVYVFYSMKKRTGDTSAAPVITNVDVEDDDEAEEFENNPGSV